MIPECPVCLQQFGEKLQPLALVCGHSICGDCYTSLKVRTVAFQASVECPECRRENCDGGRWPPVNYALLQTIQAIVAAIPLAQPPAAPAVEQKVKEEPDVVILESPPKRQRINKVAPGASLVVAGDKPLCVTFSDGSQVMATNSVIMDGDVVFRGSITNAGVSGSFRVGGRSICIPKRKRRKG